MTNLKVSCIFCKSQCTIDSYRCILYCFEKFGKWDKISHKWFSKKITLLANMFGYRKMLFWYLLELQYVNHLSHVCISYCESVFVLQFYLELEKMKCPIRQFGNQNIVICLLETCFFVIFYQYEGYFYYRLEIHSNFCVSAKNELRSCQDKTFNVATWK